jgi:uncharacterized repeat protein (TIGR02543 family)
MINPAVNTGASVPPVAWSVQWTREGAGFTSLIGAEGKALNSTTITDVFTASSTGRFNNTSTISGAPTAGAAGTWTLSKELSTYTTLANGWKSGYVNFNLTYVPFEGKTWTGVSVTTPSGGASGGKPRWIIRNGINDMPQNTNTTFTLSNGTIPWDGTKNGNGAVNFMVASVYTVEYNANGGSGTLASSTHPGGEARKLTANAFTKAGYTFAGWSASSGTATIVYTDEASVIDLAGVGGTKKLYAQWEADLGTIGGYTVYKPLYVASETYTYNGNNAGGNDANEGRTKTAPLATVETALEKIKAAYGDGSSWGKDKDGEEAYGAIVILDTVTMTGTGYMNINNMGTVVYPPILLIDDYDTSGVQGKLQTTHVYGRMLSILGEAKVTLAGNLILDGSKALLKHDPPIYSDYTPISVNRGGSFTMEGGEICNFYAFTGVWVSYGATFTMTAGKIHHNKATNEGGAVYVGNGTFTMEGGEIHDNTSAMEGGGVALTCDTSLGNPKSIFTMTGGKIYNNSARYGGGGVFVQYGEFTMEGGEIYGNTAQEATSWDASMGGGVLLDHGSVWDMVFNKTGGTIYGYSSSDSKSNVVTNAAGAVLTNKGHAIYYDGDDGDDGDRYKDSTVSGNLSLTYNAATKKISDASGW